MPSAESKQQSTDNKLLRKISQKQYWVILVILFTAISLFMAGLLWIFPPNTIGYDLAVGFLTSSFFMILTIVFFSWLLDVREKAEWYAVREEVYFKIRLELASLFIQVVDYFEGGIELKVLLMHEKENGIESLIQNLKRLRNSRLEPTNISLFFNKGEEIQEFKIIERRLAETQGLYSKHLPANITVSLMKIQRSIWALDNFKGLANGLAQASDIIPKNTLIDFENNKIELLKTQLVTLVEEMIQLFAKRELNFSFPP